MSHSLSQVSDNSTDHKLSFSISEANHADFSKCNEFVESFVGSSVYHLTDWCELITDVFGHKFFYFIAKSTENEIVGVLPVIRLKSLLFGDYMVSMPYFNYGGAVGVSAEIEQALIDQASKTASELGSQHIEFRDSKKSGVSEFIREDKVAMVLSLPNDQDTLWKNLGAKRRSQINRPVREGVEAKIGNKEILDDFYSVFSCNMRDLGTPVYSKKFFSEILRRFPDKTQLICVYHKGNPVGGAFLIGFKEQLEIPWASTLRQFNSIGVNMYMYWEVLKYAISSGYESFDFGRSSINSGTYRFKKQWGAEPKQLYWHYWLNEGQQMPMLTPTNPKYQLAIHAWQRLPLFVANTIGPFIVKNLP